MNARITTYVRRRSILALTLVLALVGFTLTPVAAQQGSTITLLHVSDYHSHAVPFYAEGQANTAGLARAIAYLKAAAQNPNTLIFSGGDTMNVGTPAWSDKYKCADWSMFNNILSAMG